jgi:hypothetical protein
MHSGDTAEQRARIAVEPAQRRTTYLPRSDGVTFRCEACGVHLHDLRGVFLTHRSAAGWRIECAQHDDAERQVDGGTLFGGGLHALEIYGELARTRGFDPADLFRAVLRLRAQACGLFVPPEPPARATGR